LSTTFYDRVGQKVIMETGKAIVDRENGCAGGRVGLERLSKLTSSMWA